VRLFGDLLESVAHVAEGKFEIEALAIWFRQRLTGIE